MATPNKNIQPIRGVWCRADNKFYYFDPGVHSSNTGPQRVIRTLTARGLIEFDPSGRVNYGEEPYRLMTLVEAKERSYEVVRLAINEPTEQQAQRTESSSSPWRKN